MLYKVCIFGSYVKQAIQNTIFYTRNTTKYEASRSDRTACCQPLLELIPRAIYWPISLKRRNKKISLSTVCSTAWDTHQLKKWAQSVHSRRSHSKRYVPCQMTKKARWPDFRAKFDLLNSEKYYRNYIWEQLQLSDNCNELTMESKWASFGGLTCRYTKRTGHEMVKMGVYVLNNFSKTAEKNKTQNTGIQVRLKLSSDQQTDQKAVHSTWNYSNINVPYQMTKLDKYGSCFAKILHLNYVKLRSKYIWEDSPLTGNFETLTFNG